MRVYNYLRYPNNKIEQERDLKKVHVIPNNFIISLEEQNILLNDLKR